MKLDNLLKATQAMKNSLMIKSALPVLLLAYLLVALAVSCDKNQEFQEQEIDLETAFNNKIFTKIDGQKIQLDKATLTSLWKEALHLDKQVKFKDFYIIKGQYTDTGKDFYQLRTESEDDFISLANVLVLQDGMLFLGGATCKCESKSCGASCKVAQNGSTCGCTPCTSACKKTSTATDQIE